MISSYPSFPHSRFSLFKLELQHQMDRGEQQGFSEAREMAPGEQADADVLVAAAAIDGGARVSESCLSALMSLARSSPAASFPHIPVCSSQSSCGRTTAWS